MLPWERLRQSKQLLELSPPLAFFNFFLGQMQALGAVLPQPWTCEGGCKKGVRCPSDLATPLSQLPPMLLGFSQLTHLKMQLTFGSDLFIFSKTSPTPPVMIIQHSGPSL